jgi:hypothetical protein
MLIGRVCCRLKGIPKGLFKSAWVGQLFKESFINFFQTLGLKFTTKSPFGQFVATLIRLKWLEKYVNSEYIQLVIQFGDLKKN